MPGHMNEHAFEGFNPRAGVYSISCRRTGKAYVGCTDHLVGALDSHRVQLSNNLHPNQAMQADWDTHGAESFDFAVHDEIPPEDCGDMLSGDLEELRDLWVDQLGLDEGRAY